MDQNVLTIWIIAALVVWLLSAVIAAFVADNRDRSAGGFFGLGLLMKPWFSLIARPRKSEVDSPGARRAPGWHGVRWSSAAKLNR